MTFQKVARSWNTTRATGAWAEGLISRPSQSTKPIGGEFIARKNRPASHRSTAHMR